MTKGQEEHGSGFTYKINVLVVVFFWYLPVLVIILRGNVTLTLHYVLQPITRNFFTFDSSNIGKVVADYFLFSLFF